ncbi:MAG: CocE/NonD family hydrolase, partial [Chloroflexota bacterium]
MGLPIAEGLSLHDRWVAEVTRENPKPVVESGIPMRDGIELAADIYLPEKSALPAPAIVTITPYDKSSPMLIASEARFYQDQGYVFVSVDCRGRGKSEGEWGAMKYDARDDHDVVEWVAKQSW